MKNVIGRIVARGNGVIGIFLPTQEGTELYGIYNIVEVMGEILVERVGDSALEKNRFDNITPEHLIALRPLSIMTKEEIEVYCDSSSGTH